ncbi:MULTISPECIES: YsnF/AvaK domain-containing protein [Aquincola]|uniref:YsnF/AvaK domain-containing protein n=1 Tax=Aquincola TaxID=391952 RepID=UPI0012ECCDFF|nr:MULTISPECIES: DUF2382 domain-containing protein [Aquincola]MCR5868106.1 YsnF/AvaK domain-containing protein [Aquincola sp. J276]
MNNEATDPIPAAASVDGMHTIAVTEEQVQVTRRVEATGAVRVRIETASELRAVPISSTSTQVVVERMAKGVVCTERAAPYYDGEVLVIPVYAEVPVITTQLVLTEELRVHRLVTARTEEHKVPLNTERAVVERLQPDGTWKEFEIR